MATPALGSVMYAGYDPANGHFGHVGGVGGRDGTHLLGIMDTSKDVLANVKEYLLSQPAIKELTRNGRHPFHPLPSSRRESHFPTALSSRSIFQLLVVKA